MRESDAKKSSNMDITKVISIDWKFLLNRSSFHQTEDEISNDLLKSM